MVPVENQMVFWNFQAPLHNEVKNILEMGFAGSDFIGINVCSFESWKEQFTGSGIVAEKQIG